MSPIDIFVWNQSFNTGLREVDEQHLRLVQLINRVAGKLALDPSLNGEDGLGALLEEFRAYAQGHFRYEEALWGRYMGGQLREARHRQLHREFEDRLAELMQEARDEAVSRMVEEARSMGANAVLNLRFVTTSITAGAAEILAYGSAVTIEKAP